MKQITILNDDQLMARVPAIFASHAEAGVSDKYSFLPTATILGGMREQGWAVVEAAEQRVSREYRRGYQKHMLRFARLADLQKFEEQIVRGRHVLDYNHPLATRMDLVVINSHDRTSGYQIYAAPQRLVCYNGLIVSDDEIEHISVRHVGFEPAQVIEASFAIAEQSARVTDTIHQWQDRVLTPQESYELAKAALALRYSDPGKAPVGAQMLLGVRRPEDLSNNLWVTWNRVQENLIKGGMTDREKTRDARRAHHRAPGKLRSVQAIDTNIKLNQALWELGAKFAAHTN